MDAEVVERRREVRGVGRQPLDAQGLASHEVGGELEFFSERQDPGAERGDVGFERVAGDGHQVLAEVDADLSSRVLVLVDALVAGVGGAHVGAHDVVLKKEEKMFFFNDFE